MTIKNLSYNGTHANPPILVECDEDRNIIGVTFENLAVNSKQISDSMRKSAWYATSDYISMFADEHVLNLTSTT